MNRQNRQEIYGWKILTTILCAALLSACSGGGGGGNDVTPTPAATSSNRTVTGGVTKGAVVGATVSFYEMGELGSKLGEAITTSTTNDNGEFTATVPAASGTLLVVTSGGSYIDESDQEPDINLKRRIELGQSQGFESILPQGATVVAINPFTGALIERARLLSDGPDFLERFNAGKAILDAQTGFDVLTTLPANPVSPAADATQAQKQYALLLGGLANVVNNLSQQLGLAGPTHAIVLELANDLIDGNIDGLVYDGQSNYGGSVDFSLVNLSNEITRFRNNNFNNYSDTSLPSIDASAFANTPPTSNAGVDKSAAQKSIVELSGSQSSDAESGLSFSWTQTGGTTVSLETPDAESTTFTAPELILGEEVLVFTLTVTDFFGQSSSDDINVTITGAIPSTFFVLDFENHRDGIGDDVDGGGKITLNPDGTGSLLAEEDTIPLTYTITNNKIRIEPPDGFIVDDFEELIDIDGDGVEELFLVEERPQFFEISVSEDRVNGDLANFHEEGTLSFTGLDTASTTPDDIFAFDFPVLIFDYAEQTAFNIVEGTKRVLSINASPQFPTLFYDDELYLDIFEFNGDGTGTTQHNGIGFNWQVQDDGHLNVAFDNGEVADYFHHTTRPSGDVLSVEYSLVEPWPESDALLVGDTRLSLVRDESDPLPTTRSDVAGIYAGLASIGLGRFEDDLSEISLSLNPDGTGVLQFEYYFENQLITLISQNGACWDVLSNGVIRVNRMHSPDLYFQGSYETTPEFCSGITGEDQIFYRFDLTLMDVVGSTYKMFDQRYDNECGEFPTTNCALEPTHFGIRITDREILTNNPPVLQGEPVAATINSPSVIDVLANDISRDLPIDPSTVEIINSPALGDATVDSTTGVITYTARAAGADFIQYRVRDTAGNLSAVGTVAVSAR